MNLPKHYVINVIITALLSSQISCASDSAALETAKQFNQRKAIEACKAFDASPFSILSKDYFSRFNRDPNAKPEKNEVLITDDWKIIISDNAKESSILMAGYLADFLNERMSVNIAVEKIKAASFKNDPKFNLKRNA